MTHEHDAEPWDKHRARHRGKRAPLAPARPVQVTAGRVQPWNDAIATLDATEPMIRDLIERELVYVAGVSGAKYGDAMKAATAVVKKIAKIRAKAIKTAFRHIRKSNGV